MRAHVLAAAILSCVTTFAAAQTAGALTDSDLVVAQVDQEADTAQVHGMLGAPDSTADPVMGWTAWYYRDVAFSFDEWGHRKFATLTGPSQRTSRGLRPGDPPERVAQLYGPAVYKDSRFVLYERAGPSWLGLTVTLQDGLVTQIIMGDLTDLEP